MTEGNEAGVLDTLAEQCEQAAGPDRWLDADIHEGVTGFNCRRAGVGWPNEDEYVVPSFPGWNVLPYYTASLDAAMTLAPNLIGVELSLDQNDRWHCELSTNDLDGDGEARAATKELAFVAAALRARTQPPPLSDEGD